MQEHFKIESYHISKKRIIAPALKKIKKVLAFYFLCVIKEHVRKICGYSSGVERNLAKVDVVGPNPIARSN